jgi:hypothetical protein
MAGRFRPDDELLAKAMTLGAQGAQRYSGLAHLLEAEGVELEWRPRDGKPARLTVEKAHRQYVRLIAAPPVTEERMPINGSLYRVITEPSEGTEPEALGSLGIHLYPWPVRPIEQGQRERLLAHYESSDVPEAIKGGLLDEPVEADLLVRRPRPGSSINPKRADFIVEAIRPGPPEDSAKGMRIDELLDEGEP